MGTSFSPGHIRKDDFKTVGASTGKEIVRRQTTYQMVEQIKKKTKRSYIFF